MVAQLIGIAQRGVLQGQPSPLPDQGGKRVAVLCGGHSLREDWSEERGKGFAEVVAVNGACFLFSCDYAVMVDRPIVQRLFNAPASHPRKALVTYKKSYAARFIDKKHLSQLPMIEVANVAPGVKSFTMPRALRFALGLAGTAGTVEIFGMDFSDAGTDVAGLKGDHGPDRWKREADVLRLVWDRRIVAVHGKVRPTWLAFFRGERSDWTP